MLNLNDLRIAFLQSVAKNPGISLRVNSAKNLQFAAGERSNAVILRSAQDDSAGGLAETPRLRKCRNSRGWL